MSPDILLFIRVNTLNKSTGFKHLIQALSYSIKGFIATIKTESAFRQELLMTAVLLPFSFVLAHSNIHLAILIGSLLFVLPRKPYISVIHGGDIRIERHRRSVVNVVFAAVLCIGE